MPPKSDLCLRKTSRIRSLSRIEAKGRSSCTKKPWRASLKVKGRLPGESGIETKIKSLLGLFLLNDQGGISRIAKAWELTRDRSPRLAIFNEIRNQPPDDLRKYLIATVPFVPGTYRRIFGSFEQAASEAGIGRIFDDIHFSFDTILTVPRSGKGCRFCFRFAQERCS